MSPMTIDEIPLIPEGLKGYLENVRGDIRRKEEALSKEQDPEARAQLQSELESLRQREQAKEKGAERYRELSKHD